MEHEARAIRLTRERLGDFDERVGFLTLEFGRVHAMSFGSRSPKSRRGALLAGHDWLDLRLVRARGRFTVKAAELAERNAAFAEGRDPTWFQRGLDWAARLLPDQAPEERSFRWLHLVSQVEWKWVPEIRETILAGGLLEAAGIKPPGSALCQPGSPLARLWDLLSVDPLPAVSSLEKLEDAMEGAASVEDRARMHRLVLERVGGSTGV